MPCLICSAFSDIQHITCTLEINTKAQKAQANTEAGVQLGGDYKHAYITTKDQFRYKTKQKCQIKKRNRRCHRWAEDVEI
ncbi:unnamed protein product [Prunus armeniaca]|uniref:Uncharacterized protein n=1 Tax=Prunus armeniaca TaxID=36596 RepID=A0A6J5UHW7_PRUAR|nr:unnamed protein product [Prunus armeniaca]